MLLQKIQTELKAPKGQLNKFGGYKYRSCEDILEALKPVLAKYEAAVILSDEVVEIAGRIYVKATATLKAKDITESTTAFAREPEVKKGMDESQITGAASSYARKYALNGLFGIDDTKDADTMDNREEGQKSATKPAPKATTRQEAKKEENKQAFVLQSEHIIRMNNCMTLPDLNDCMTKIKAELGSNFEAFRPEFTKQYNRRKEEIMKETEGFGV